MPLWLFANSLVTGKSPSRGSGQVRITSKMRTSLQTLEVRLFCHVHCDRLGQRTQSTPCPLPLINPGLECCIQGVAICVPGCVKASFPPSLFIILPSVPGHSTDQCRTFKSLSWQDSSAPQPNSTYVKALFALFSSFKKKKTRRKNLCLIYSPLPYVLSAFGKISALV